MIFFSIFNHEYFKCDFLQVIISYSITQIISSPKSFFISTDINRDATSNKTFRKVLLSFLFLLQRLYKKKNWMRLLYFVNEITKHKGKEKLKQRKGIKK